MTAKTLPKSLDETIEEETLNELEAEKKITEEIGNVQIDFPTLGLRTTFEITYILPSYERPDFTIEGRVVHWEPMPDLPEPVKPLFVNLVNCLCPYAPLVKSATAGTDLELLGDSLPWEFIVEKLREAALERSPTLRGLLDNLRPKGMRYGSQEGSAGYER